MPTLQAVTNVCISSFPVPDSLPAYWIIEQERQKINEQSAIYAPLPPEFACGYSSYPLYYQHHISLAGRTRVLVSEQMLIIGKDTSMEFKLGYSSLRWKEPNVEEALKQIKDTGWDGWEVRQSLDWLGSAKRLRVLLTTPALV